MKIYRNLIVTLMMILLLKSGCFASFLWKIDVGVNEYHNNNFQFAKDYFISYLNNNPNNKDGYWWLGRTYLSLHDNKAQLNFKKSYELLSKEQNIEKLSFNIKNSANIEDYFDMATMFFESGNIKEADFYADMMLKINPKSASAYYIKAGVKNIEDDYSKAKEYMENAIIYNNDLLNTKLAQSLGITTIPKGSAKTYSLFSFESYFEGNLNDAIAYLKKANELEPTNPEIASSLAELYFKNNQLEPVFKVLDVALKANDNNVSLLLNKAKLSGLEKNKNSQLNYIQKAYKVNPNNPKALLALGNYYFENNDFENSKKYFENLTSVDDSLYEGIFGYAYSLLELGQTDKASVEIRKLNKLNPNASEISYLLSKICSYEGNYKEALDYIEEALREDENPNYYIEEAKLNYILKNYKISLQSLDDAVVMPYSAINEDEITEYYIKNYIKLKKPQDAKRLLDELSMNDKNKILYKYDLYNLYKMQGDDEKAFTTFSEIKRFKPASVQDYIDLSEIFYETKGIESAIKILDTGLRKYSDNRKLYFQKIKLYALSKDKTNQQETLKKLKTLD